MSDSGPGTMLPCFSCVPVGGTHMTRPLLCRVGLHRWPELGRTWWLEEPRPTRNELGLAIEARVCERCGRLTNVSTWRDSADEDYGVPKGIGPLAGARMLEVITRKESS